LPITPFHLGPGAAFKALLGRRFSFTVFAFSQGLIDLEPIAWWLATGDPLHPALHTYAGALVVAALAFWPGRPVCEWVLRRYNAGLSPSQARWLAVPPAISPLAAASAALLGAWSHVFLDSIMHFDVRPWAPFAAGNALHEVISIDALHLACVAAGAAGVLVLIALAAFAARK
jgi:hypothetical protein